MKFPVFLTEYFGEFNGGETLIPQRFCAEKEKIRIPGFQQSLTFIVPACCNRRELEQIANQQELDPSKGRSFPVASIGAAFHNRAQVSNRRDGRASAAAAGDNGFKASDRTRRDLSAGRVARPALSGEGGDPKGRGR